MLLALGVPASALADSLYVEFSPDFGQSLLVATSEQPVEQVFLPLNDHFSALDFWVSNNNTAGPATFEIYGPSGTLLSSKTQTVPAIADGPSGTRVKVSLPGQLAVTANQAYVARISTAVPSLRLYHADQQKLLAHNAPPQAAYSGGLARINGEDKGFAFKFALYEGSETTSPVITNLSATVISVQEVRLIFNASEPVDSSAAYGPHGQGQSQSVAYSGQYTACPEGIQTCSLVLPVTTTGSTHDFTLTVKDVWGNTAQATGTFTSAGVSVSPTPGTPTQTPATPTPPPDTTPPVITNVRTVNLTHDSAGIAWTTNEAANSLAVIQFGADRITAGGGSDSTLELEHLVTVSGLGYFTPYTASIKSSDGSGNESSAQLQFTTLPAPTPLPAGGPGGSSPTPTPASAGPTPTVSIGPTQGSEGQSARWQTPSDGPPSNGYRIDIIGADGKVIRTIRTNDTSADLGVLPEGATLIVYADDGGTFEKVAAPRKIQKPLLARFLSALPYAVGGIGLVAVLGTGGWLLVQRRRKQSLPPPATEPPGPFVSGS